MGQSRKRKPLPQQPQPVKKSFIKVVDKGVILSKIRTAQFSEREVKRRRKSIVLALVLIVALLGYVILVITTAGSNQGVLLFEQGKYKQALPHLRAEALAYPSIQTQQRLGRTLVALEKFEEAKAPLAEALKAHSVAGFTLETVDVIKDLKKAGVQGPMNGEWKIMLESAALLDDIHVKLKGKLDKSIEGGKRYTQLGMQSANNGGSDLVSIFHFLKAVIQSPTQSTAHNNLALCFVRLNMNQRALKAYKRAIKFDPQNDQLETQKAQVEHLAELLKPAEASKGSIKLRDADAKAKEKKRSTQSRAKQPIAKQNKLQGQDVRSTSSARNEENEKIKQRLKYSLLNNKGAAEL